MSDPMGVRVLAILGEGGHTVQMLKLVALLGDEYDYSYLMPQNDRTSEAKIEIPGPIYRAHIPRGKNSINWRRSVLCLLQELRVLWRVRPQVILSVGAGIAVPVSVFGRLAGARVIHVESASRVHSLSLTGRIMYRVAHLFFVQWEPLRERYPKAIYAGRLL